VCQITKNLLYFVTLSKKIGSYRIRVFKIRSLLLSCSIFLLAPNHKVEYLLDYSVLLNFVVSERIFVP
jgi:hypothetical protein